MSLDSRDSNSIWVGVFADAEQAKNAALKLNFNETAPFTTKKWLATQREMLLSAKKGFLPRNSILPILCALFEKEERLCVYDLGGGSGWIYEYLKQATKKSINYINQELLETCQEFESEFDLETSVKFTDHPCVNLNVDILYSNSTLQYFEDFSVFLTLAEGLAPKYILLDDVQTSTENDFFSLQRYYENFMVTKFYNIKKLAREMERIEYRLLLDIPYSASFSSVMEPIIANRLISDPDRSLPRSLLFQHMSILS